MGAVRGLRPLRVIELGPSGPSAARPGVTFVLIAWSASFTYLEMERNWRTP